MRCLQGLVGETLMAANPTAESLTYSIDDHTFHGQGSEVRSLFIDAGLLRSRAPASCQAARLRAHLLSGCPAFHAG